MKNYAGELKLRRTKQRQRRKKQPKRRRGLGGISNCQSFPSAVICWQSKKDGYITAEYHIYGLREILREF